MNGYKKSVSCYKLFLLLFLLFLCKQYVLAQNPIHFIYNDENGLPSNEVYNILQDSKGFIWIGTDAGLYKYNGVKYIRYTGDSQKSKSITGLSFTNSGTLYCHNFHSQIFYVENNVLKELSHPFKMVTNIATDIYGNLLITHGKGLASYNEKTKKWTQCYTDKGVNKIGKSIRTDANGNASFVVKSGLGVVSNNHINIINHQVFKENEPGYFIIEYWEDTIWVFSINGSVIYQFKNKEAVAVVNTELNKLLHNKKITNVKNLKDGNLWICTYEGIIQYNPLTKKANLLYPQYTFSDCILDREGNYWFSTLQAGIFRMPNANFLVWDASHPNIKNDKLTKITSDGQHIYFSTINGYLGKIHAKSHLLNMYHTGISADIQSLNYDDIDHQISFYNKYGSIFLLKNNKLVEKPVSVSAIKYVKHVANTYFYGSSLGLFVQESTDQAPTKIADNWIREIEYSKSANQLWTATNNGVLTYTKQNEKWINNQVFFPEKQVVSICLDTLLQNIYALSFSGEIYQISKNSKVSPIAKLNKHIQAYQLKFYQNKLYVATNQGLHIYHIKPQKWEVIDKLSGISSNNVQGIALLNGYIWLATGKGLNKIPINSQSHQKSKANIYLPYLNVGKNKLHTFSNIKLVNQQFITVQPEASIYSSNGNFNFAYRLKNLDSNWIVSPALADKIEIKNIPIGKFEIELKAIDHLGRNSENQYSITGYMYPPFWKSTWFILISLLVLSGIIYLAYKLRIRHITRQQAEEIERITLENKLRLSQETALRAQMNPHFIFNVLNSIKSYFYENDKKNASIYLQKFADLIRKVLHHSAMPTIKLSEEIELLNIYIQLEALLFPNEFAYTIKVDDGIDTDFTTIPTFVIQPYVENAFKHGLRHKEGNKQLDILFEQSHGSIKATITDNGIGRAKSAQINKENKSVYPSFSTNAIYKRIELLNQQQSQISVEILDLADENQNSLGTKVVLTFNLYA